MSGGKGGTSSRTIRDFGQLPASHPGLITSSVFSPEELSALNVILIRCGTPEGYRQHLKERDIPCGECASAYRADPFTPSLHRSVCGSNQGWLSHRRRMERPCEPCAQARERHVEDSHGTYAGWMLHRRAGTMCDRCLLARNQYQNSRPRKSRPRRGTTS